MMNLSKYILLLFQNIFFLSSTFLNHIKSNFTYACIYNLQNKYQCLSVSRVTYNLWYRDDLMVQEDIYMRLIRDKIYIKLSRGQ